MKYRPGLHICMEGKKKEEKKKKSKAERTVQTTVLVQDASLTQLLHNVICEFELFTPELYRD